MNAATMVRTQVFIYLSTIGVDAVLRWMLNKASADAAIYLRDALLFGILGFSFWYGLQNRVDFRHVAALWWSFMLLMGIGLTAGLPVPQVLFGLKVWIPFAVGFMLVDSGAVAALNRPRIWAALWMVLCFGIAANYFVRFPWTGLTVQLGDANVQINREWTTYGVKRLSGFSRSSYDGAILVLLLHIYLINFTRGFWRKVSICAISGAAIMLTTSKGAIGALIATLPLAVLLPLIRSRASLLRPPMLAMMSIAALIGLFAPAFSVQLSAPTFTRGSIEAKLFASLVDRGWATWPFAFGLLEDWQVLIGRGMGGIGAAQSQFEPLLANPADNFFVYLFVTGGVFGLLFYMALAVLGFRLSLTDTVQRTLFTYLLAIFTYGMTASIIDNAAFAIAVGGVFAALTCNPFSRRSASESEVGFEPGSPNISSAARHVPVVPPEFRPSPILSRH